MVIMQIIGIGGWMLFTLGLAGDDSKSGEMMNKVALTMQVVGMLGMIISLVGILPLWGV